MKRVLVLLSGLVLSLVVFNGYAEEPVDSKASEAIKARFQLLDSRIDVLDIAPTPLEGLYLVQLSTSDLLYVSADGKYVIDGDLLSVGGSGVVNLTKAARSLVNAQLLSGFPRDKMIVFPAKGETKAAITVFTDVDCGYCRKLHAEVPQLNAMGIEVRYMAFPRGGQDAPAYAVMENVWCAEDPGAAMTLAKSGRSVADASCVNPVKEEYELGLQLGVRGTPALFLDDGTMIPGYRPANELAKDLGLL